MKYICTVCGWEYDESAGYPEGGIAPVRYGARCRRILNAPCAAWARTASRAHELSVKGVKTMSYENSGRTRRRGFRPWMCAIYRAASLKG